MRRRQRHNSPDESDCQSGLIYLNERLVLFDHAKSLARSFLRSTCSTRAKHRKYADETYLSSVSAQGHPASSTSSIQLAQFVPQRTENRADGGGDRRACGRPPIGEF
jgi:hypothetical protein